MKTVEEACEATFVYKFDETKPIPAQDQIAEKINEDIAHWRGIDDEIRHCKWVHFFVAQMVGLVASGRMPLGEALMATAVQFVAVGMQMSDAEPAIATESVPGRREAGV